MLRLRPYKASDAETILSWQMSEKQFYQWTAGILGPYPLDRNRFDEKTRELMRFTLLDEKEAAGFFTLRNPGDSLDEVRFGFVIVDPAKRGRGYGKAMLRLGLAFCREVYGAKRATLGVFENNAPAWYCYRAAGFQDITQEKTEAYPILDESWPCREMAIEIT